METKLLLVALGGMLGAISRYIVSSKLATWDKIPLGTLTVNVIGSVLLGVLITLFKAEIISENIYLLSGVGFMGAFTTMSSFAVDTLLLFEDSTISAAKNLGIMLGLVLIGVTIGRKITLFLLQN